MLHCQLQYSLQLILAVIIYFFVILPITNTIITIITIIAITINIPNPIPALKIPSITSQEVSNKERRKRLITLNRFIFFMILFLKVIYLLYFIE